MYVFSVTPPPPHVPRPQAVPDHSKRDGTVRHVRNWTVALVLATALVAVLGLVVGPAVLGYRTTVMPSASGMAGSIEPGDVVVSVPRSATDLKVGDVLTFDAPVGDHEQVTHRVVSLQQTAAGIVVETKGDAKPTADPWRTTITDDEVWVTAYVVPKLGPVVNAIDAVVLRYGAIWLAVGGVLLLALSLLRKSEPRRPARVPESRPALRLVTSDGRR